jgi:hypothetical protein
MERIDSFYKEKNLRDNNLLLTVLQSITLFPGVYDIKDQEMEDELEKCRQYAAANFPVSKSP